MSNFKLTKKEEYETLAKNAKRDAIVNAFNTGTYALVVLGLEILKKKVGMDVSDGFRQTVFHLIEPAAAICSMGSVVGLAKELAKKSHYEDMVEFTDELYNISRGGR